MSLSATEPSTTLHPVITEYRLSVHTFVKLFRNPPNDGDEHDVIVTWLEKATSVVDDLWIICHKMKVNGFPLQDYPRHETAKMQGLIHRVQRILYPSRPSPPTFAYRSGVFDHYGDVDESIPDSRVKSETGETEDVERDKDEDNETSPDSGTSEGSEYTIKSKDKFMDYGFPRHTRSLGKQLIPRPIPLTRTPPRLEVQQGARFTTVVTHATWKYPRKVLRG
ncbi:hypothetical protein BU17DRAFT_80949 [Hysterangium stoloniferum]|nr:hypothetical protein BU17DRAFT_80949 [Hysterangium stoloniferum]